jgi:glycosyltransferase involved in cell wall biosynthesis
MKIILLVPTLGYGGSKKSVVNFARILSVKYDVKIVLFDGNNNVHNTNVEIINLNIPANKNIMKKIINFFRRIFMFKKILKSNNPDITLSFMHGANLVNFFTSSKGFKMFSCRGYGDLVKHLTFYRILSFFNKFILFNSQELMNFFKLKSKNYSKVNFLYNFLFTSEINTNSESLNSDIFDFIKNKFSILNVGNLNFNKGQSNLIKSFEFIANKHQDTRLVIVGGGPLQKELQEQIFNSIHKDKILLTGFRGNVSEIMKNFSIFVLSSINEGFPNVLIEAMNNKLPVISTDCMTGPKEIFGNVIKEADFKFCEFGLLTKPFKKEYINQSILNDSHFSMISAIFTFIEDKEVYLNYLEKSFERSKYFSSSELQKSYYNLFEKVMGL